MELLLYFLFVAAAIGGLVLILNKLGLGASSAVSIDEAMSHFQSAYPDIEDPLEIIEAGRAVLMSFDNRKIGIVRPLGHFPVVKLLSKAELKDMRIGDSRLLLRLYDFADPLIQLDVEDPESVHQWIESRL